MGINRYDVVWLGILRDEATSERVPIGEKGEPNQKKRSTSRDKRRCVVEREKGEGGGPGYEKKNIWASLKGNGGVD